MFKVWLCLVLVLVSTIPVLATNGCHSTDPECGSFPVSNCDVRMSTFFYPTVHQLEYGIDICASNIVVDCGGATLQYINTQQQSAGSAVAISVDNVNNSYVANCKIYDYWRGIKVSNSHRNYIMDNYINTSSQLPLVEGIRLEVSQNNTILNNNISLQNIGISMIGSDYNLIDGNYLWKNYATGLILSSSNRNMIINNIAVKNFQGYGTSSSNLNKLQNNVVIYNTGNGIEILNTGNSFILADNLFCFNNQGGFSSAAFDIRNQGNNNTGMNNTCLTYEGWNESNSGGCTFRCTPNITIYGSPNIGNTIQLRIQDPASSNIPYIAGLSLGNSPGIVLNDSRTIPLNYDPLLQLVLDPVFGPASGFQNFHGTLDNYGRATLSVTIPPNAVLINLSVYAAFITVNYSTVLPQAVINISNAHRIIIHP